MAECGEPLGVLRWGNYWLYNAMKWWSKYYLVYYIPHDSLFEFLVPICQIISERVTKSINSLWSMVAVAPTLPGTGLFVTVWSIQINMHESVRWGESGLHIYTPRSPHSNSKILGLTTAWFGGAEEMFIHNWVSEIHLETNPAYHAREPENTEVKVSSLSPNSSIVSFSKPPHLLCAPLDGLFLWSIVGFNGSLTFCLF